MTNPTQMGTLLSRMTAQQDAPKAFDDTQVKAMIEIVMPGIVRAPGMPAGMKCEVTRESEKVWVLRVERP